MADFVLNDLNIKYNIPINFELEFDIDKQKMYSRDYLRAKILPEISEEEYYNLDYIDANLIQNEESVDIMKEFKLSSEVFSNKFANT